MKKVFLFVLGLVVLQASLLEASKNAGPTSNRSSNKNGGGQRGGGGGWGSTGDSSYRGRREVEEEEPEETRLKRSFAPGAPSVPSVPSTQQGGSQQGGWGVSVNKDKGTGPQIRTEAQGNIYKNGNVRVDGQGHHEFGKGRKPSYGGSIRGRWRRDAEEGPDDLPQVREKRQFNYMPQTQPGRFNTMPQTQPGRFNFMPQPQQPRFPQPAPGDRGSIGVTINKDQGRGPQIRTEGQGRIYTSKDGNWRVDGNGYHEAGRGRKPDYGVGVKVEGRFRREVEDEVSEDEQIEVSGRDKRSVRKPNELPIAIHPIPPKWRIQPVQPIRPQILPIQPDVQPIRPQILPIQPDVQPITPLKPVEPYSRLRRDAEDETIDETETLEPEEVDETGTRGKRSPQDRGSVDVSVNKDQGRGPQVRTDVQGNIYTSKDGNWRVDGNGYHEAGRGRKPDYGGGITVTGRFRREVDDEVSEDEQIEDAEVSERDKRSIRQPKPIQPVRPIRPIKPIRPIRPVQPHRRLRREAEDEQIDETATLTEGTEEVAREKRSPQDRGSVSVSVNKDQGRGPQVRTDAQYNIYKKNNWEINSHANHEFGHGRKPSYGGGVSITKRFRRDLEGEEEEDEQIDETASLTQGTKEVAREKRSPQDRGSVSVSVNKDQGRGPQVRTDAQYNIYKKNNWEVNSHANHEFGRGRKPSYGGGVSVTKRFRRDIEGEEEEDEQIEEEVAEREKRSPDGPKIIKTVYIRPLKPKKVVIYRKARDVENEEQIEQDEEESETREKRSLGRPPRPDVLINRPVHRPYPRPAPRPIRPYPRLRREAEDEPIDEPEVREKRSPQKKGSVNVSVNKDQGRGPQVRTDAQYQIYKKNNWEVNSHANHEFGRGRKPSYGGGISVSKRF